MSSDRMGIGTECLNPSYGLGVPSTEFTLSLAERVRGMAWRLGARMIRALVRGVLKVRKFTQAGQRSSAMRKIKIIELDHIVLNVRDIDRSLKFYTEILAISSH